MPDETRVRLRLGDVKLEKITFGGKTYSRVSVKGCTSSSRAGEPELPVMRFEVAASESAVCLVENCVWEEFEAPPPVPSAGAYWRSFGFEGERKEDSEIYREGIFPRETAGIQANYLIRGVQGAGVLLRPVCYDFSRGLFRIARSMDVRVSDSTRLSHTLLDSNSSFANIQTRLFVNGQSLVSARNVGNPIGSLLIVVPDAWNDSLEAFAEWKRRLGFDVKIADYPGDSGEGAEALAAYIRKTYSELSVTHIILCGDCDDVPPAYTSDNTINPGVLEPTSDTRYAFLSGDDYVADAFISRVPAHSGEQLQAVLTKLIAYEMDPPEDDDWRAKPLVMCSTEMSSTGIYRNNSDYELLKNNYEAWISNGVYQRDDSRLLCDETAVNNNVQTVLNGDGAALFTYLGHGKYNSFIIASRPRFTVENAIGLKNGPRLPFVLAPVCDSGNFANPRGDCIAEAFFLNESNNEDGAVAVVSATSNTLWNPPIKCIERFSELLVESYSENRCLSMGEFFLQSIIAGMQLADSEHSSFVESPGQYLSCQMHLFGDCTMMPRLRKLRKATVETFQECDSLSVSVKWEDDGTPVNGAYVSIASNVRPYSKCALTDGSGNVVFSDLGFYGEATLNVNDASFRPYSAKVVIDSDCNLDSDGNGIVSNSEILGYLAHLEGCPSCASKLDDAIDLWKQGGLLPDAPEIETLTGNFCDASASGDNSYGGIVAAMDELATQFSTVCRVEHIGQSIAGRRIQGLCICAADEDSVPHLMLAGGFSSGERNSTQIALHLARFLIADKKLISNAAFHIVPLMYPDEWEDGTVHDIELDQRPEYLSFMRWADVNSFSAAVLLSSGESKVICPESALSADANCHREFDALRNAWSNDTVLFSGQASGAEGNEWLSTLFNNVGILAIEVSPGESKQLEGKKLQSLCAACEKPFDDWSRTALKGVSLSLSDVFPISSAELPCSIIIDKEPLGMAVAGHDRHVWLSPKRKLFRTLANGQHEIVAVTTGADCFTHKFTVSDDATDIKLKFPTADGSLFQGLAFSTRRYIPNGDNCFEAEYTYTEKCSLIWNVKMLSGGTAFGIDSKASRMEEDGSFSFLFIDAPAHGKLRCKVSPSHGAENGTTIASKLIWHDKTSEATRLWHAREKHTVSIHLEQGWNLVGSTMTAMLPKNIKAWRYDSAFLQSYSFLPGQAFWVFSDKKEDYIITGWESDDYVDITNAGWNLLSPLRHLSSRQGCLEYSSESRSFIKATGVLKPGKAYWVLEK